MRETRITPGPWTWEIEDQSVAILCGPGGLEDYVMSVSLCRNCASRQPDNATLFGVCTIPHTEDARVIAASWALLDQLEYMADTRRCGCGHPACKRCQDDAENDRVIAVAYGKAR